MGAGEPVYSLKVTTPNQEHSTFEIIFTYTLTHHFLPLHQGYAFILTFLEVCRLKEDAVVRVIPSKLPISKHQTWLGPQVPTSNPPMSLLRVYPTGISRPCTVLPNNMLIEFPCKCLIIFSCMYKKKYYLKQLRSRTPADGGSHCGHLPEFLDR